MTCPLAESFGNNFSLPLDQSESFVWKYIGWETDKLKINLFPCIFGGTQYSEENGETTRKYQTRNIQLIISSKIF